MLRFTTVNPTLSKGNLKGFGVGGGGGREGRDDVGKVGRNSRRILATSLVLLVYNLLQVLQPPSPRSIAHYSDRNEKTNPNISWKRE